MRLTDKAARDVVLLAGKTDLIIFDETLAGFGLRLRAGGKRTWIAQYRFGATQRRMNLGTVEAMACSQARKIAGDLFAKARLGTDPYVERAEAHRKAAQRLEAGFDLYLAAAKARLRPGSYRELERHLKTHWRPLAARSIHTLGRSEIATRLEEIAAGSGVVTANRCRSSLSSFFSWAMQSGRADANPVVLTAKAGEERSRDRVLSENELRLVWRNCKDDDYGRIIRLLILTGQRREEVGGIADSEINLAKRVWILPAGRVKNRTAHEVPLAAAAVDLIDNIPRRVGRDLLFGERDDRPFSGWSRCKAALEARLIAGGSLLSPWRIHDLRRSVATGMAEIGVLPHVIEAILNHQSGSKSGVAGIYNRSSYAAEKRESLTRWARHIVGAVDCHADASASEVTA